MTYVGGEKRPGCVFCNALAADDDRAMLILHRGEHAFIMLNLYPYNSGHTMVVPYAHVASLELLDSAARSELLDLASLDVEASRRVLGCDGLNLGLNLGEVAGAGVADHLHMHVVPRWTGDANFMPILGDTMVMPELLPATYARLRGEIESIVGRRTGRPIVAASAFVVLVGSGVVLADRGVSRLPTATIVGEETPSAAALRAARTAFGIGAAIAGWAGVVDEPHGRTACFLLTIHTSDSDTDLATLPVASLPEAFAGSPVEELLPANLPILARLVGNDR